MRFWWIIRTIIEEIKMMRMHEPAHPGEVLKEFLPSEMSIGEIASRLGVSRPHLSRLLNGHTSMTADMAIRVAILTSTTPESWLANQLKWDLWQSLQKKRPLVEPLPLAKAV
jgi:antitoxin HigA-1